MLAGPGESIVAGQLTACEPMRWAQSRHSRHGTRNISLQNRVFAPASSLPATHRVWSEIEAPMPLIQNKNLAKIEGKNNRSEMRTLSLAVLRHELAGLAERLQH
jgi:hypothetical protein